EERREALLSYQERLDLAQERIDRGDLSDADFDELESLMDEDIPSAFRQGGSNAMQPAGITPQPGSTGMEYTDDALDGPGAWMQ
ncbi:MAG: hypothetical protein AAF968_26805, partial [Pseudomonadota bacterium]